MTTILIVDDNVISQRMLSFTLEKGGYDVVTALHGAEAIERLAARQCDLVIADLNMPVMDGITLLRHLRADRNHSTLPFIMLTASGQDGDRQTARRAGASDFLTKPTSSRELIETVDRLLVE
jgi:two-component system chemotaxis response regulator CheY